MSVSYRWRWYRQGSSRRMLAPRDRCARDASVFSSTGCQQWTPRDRGYSRTTDEHGVTQSCADQQDRENARPSVAQLVGHSEGDSRNHHTRLNFRVPLGQKTKAPTTRENTRRSQSRISMASSRFKWNKNVL